MIGKNGKKHNMSFSNTIILFDSSSNIEDLKKIKKKDALIVSFDYESHKQLSQNKIPHEISDKYLSKDDLKKIYKESFNFSRWYEEPTPSNFLEYEKINLGKLFYIELHHFLIPFLKKFLELIHISNKYSNSTFFATNILYDICKSLISSVTYFGTKQDNQKEFLYDSIKYQLTNSFSINISRKSYFKLKKISEGIIHTLLKGSQNTNLQKSVLLVEFDPIRYEKFLESSTNFPINLILFNRRRPVVWNKKSYSIIKKSNCFVVTSQDLISNEVKNNIKKMKNVVDQKLYQLLNNEKFFNTFFMLGNTSFWGLIKPFFIELCTKRIEEAIPEIEITKQLFKKNKISCILVWSESGFNEQIVIKLAKKENIKIVLLQHGFYWETLENQKSNEFEGIFPIESDKLLVWGEISKHHAIECGFSGKTETTGSLIYDTLFDRKNKISSGKEGFVLLATSSPVKNEVFDLTVKTMHDYEHAIEMICKTILKLNKKLIIKLHPFQEELDITPIVKKFGDKIITRKVGDILPLIESCEVFLTIDYSTTILEAQILEKPVISILVKDRLTTQTPPVFSSNSCLTTTIEDFEHTIKKVLNDSNLKIKLIENGKKFVNNYLLNQGTAVNKTLQFLEKYG